MEDVRFKVFDLAMTNRVGLGGLNGKGFSFINLIAADTKCNGVKRIAGLALKRALQLLFKK